MWQKIIGQFHNEVPMLDFYAIPMNLKSVIIYCMSGNDENN